MEIGDAINGYVIIGVAGETFTNKNAGYCRWTFVEKDTIQYFMKEFLSPTYPIDNCSDIIKAKRKLQCDTFEKYHISLKEKINTEIGLLNHPLINTLDFFRYQSKFYKITKKVNVTEKSIADIYNFSLTTKLYLLQSVSKALELLHRLNIVHGDLKPENILVSAIGDGTVSSKLIDYDNSYISGQPPVRESVVGDLLYYSPEIEKYILGDIDGSTITTKSDIFSLGIIFCQFLTGKMPMPVSGYVSNMVNNGITAYINTEGVSPYLPADIVNLVNKMLQKLPSMRPSINEILNVLGENSDKRPLQTGRLIINLGNKR